MKIKKYTGRIYKTPTHEIYLNINHLEKGTYKLKILNKNRIIKKIDFNKE